MPRRRTTADGFDPVGPFHPYLVWAAILLFDIVLVLAALAGLTWLSDRVEDVLWPGGREWVDF